MFPQAVALTSVWERVLEVSVCHSKQLLPERADSYAARCEQY